MYLMLFLHFIFRVPDLPDRPCIAQEMDASGFAIHCNLEPQLPEGVNDAQGNIDDRESLLGYVSLSTAFSSLGVS